MFKVEADSRCDGECLHRPGPSTCNAICTGAATKLRLMEQACCGCSTVRGRRRTQGACSSLPLLGTRVMQSACRANQAPAMCVIQSACHADQASAMNLIFTGGSGATMELRLIVQACGCSTVRGMRRTQCACSSLPLLGTRVMESGTKHLQCMCAAYDCVRRCWTQGACSFLPGYMCRGECGCQQGTSTCNVCVLHQNCHEAPTDGASLRLLDCSKWKRTGWRVLAPPWTKHLQRDRHWSRHEAPTDGASVLRLLDCARQETDSMCVLVSASSWHSGDGECLPPGTKHLQCV